VKHFLLSASLLFCAVKLIADSSGMTMHRVQAGTPEDDGWYTACSTNGAFSVRLPIPFNDFTAPATDDGKERCFVLGAKSSEGVKFSAVRLPILKPRKSIHDFLLESVHGLESKGIPTEKHFVEIDGRECVDYTVKNGRSGAFFRVIGLTDGSVVMTVEYPVNANSDTIRQAATKFFASAKILKQKPNHVPLPTASAAPPAATHP